MRRMRWKGNSDSMPLLRSFTFLTLNGFTHGPKGDISWHRHGAEESAYAAEGANSGSVLVFGRKTYQMMASYWPTPMALEQNPAVAKGMNDAEKIVFSKTLRKAAWSNTTLVKKNIVGEMRRLKQIPGKDMTILGSGSIVALFAEAGLIDEFQIMLDPVAIGKGTTLFRNIKRKLDLTLVDTRTFKSGVVLLTYHTDRTVAG
jgi:dihydrofolate reductase